MCTKGHRESMHKALTLLEMVIAMSIMAVVFMAILPQFRNIENNWDVRRANAEVIQNSRVLVDHMSRMLSEAVRITAASDPSEVNGYIEFEDSDGTVLRYDISPTGYIRFGPVDSQSELAGPVSELRFSCYGLDNLTESTMKMQEVRFVGVQVVVDDPSEDDQDRSFVVESYLSVNANNLPRIVKKSDFEFDVSAGGTPDICRINDVRYLVAYSGVGNDGWAVVLGVDKTDWSISKGVPVEFDTTYAKEPFLVKIDSTHYLCVYTGPDGDGWAVVLTVSMNNWTISVGAPFEFDNEVCLAPSVIQVDKDNYLCAYTGPSSDGWAVVLTVQSGSWTLTKSEPLEFDPVNGESPCLVRIKEVDDIHYLCAYTGVGNKGCAAVLTVNRGVNKVTLSKESYAVFDNINGGTPWVSRVRTGRCLCVYEGPGSDGWAVVLEVALGTWNITTETFYEFDETECRTPKVILHGDHEFFCVYSGSSFDGCAMILDVDVNNWEISKGLSLLFDETEVYTPDLEQIDSDHYFCVYTGQDLDGWAVVFGVDNSILP